MSGPSPIHKPAPTAPAIDLADENEALKSEIEYLNSMNRIWERTKEVAIVEMETAQSETAALKHVLKAAKLTIKRLKAENEATEAEHKEEHLQLEATERFYEDVLEEKEAVEMENEELSARLDVSEMRNMDLEERNEVLEEKNAELEERNAELGAKYVIACNDIKMQGSKIRNLAREQRAEYKLLRVRDQERKACRILLGERDWEMVESGRAGKMLAAAAAAAAAAEGKKLVPKQKAVERVRKGGGGVRKPVMEIRERWFAWRKSGGKREGSGLREVEGVDDLDGGGEE